MLVTDVASCPTTCEVVSAPCTVVVTSFVISVEAAGSLDATSFPRKGETVAVVAVVTVSLTAALKLDAPDAISLPKTAAGAVGFPNSPPVLSTAFMLNNGVFAVVL